MSGYSDGMGYFFSFLWKMKQGKVVAAVDSSTDRAHRHINNGVFLDGRTKTLKGYGLTQQQQIASTEHTSKKKESKEVEGNRDIAKFCIKEDYHYKKWMKH